MWDYCRGSAASLFGGVGFGGQPVACEPDPLWLRLLNAITSMPGVKRSELTRQVREPADAIGVALDGLRASGMAYSVMVKGEGSGRAGNAGIRVRGDGDNLNTSLPPFTSLDSPDGGKEGKKENSPWVVQSDGEEAVEGKKENNMADGRMFSFFPSQPIGEPELVDGLRNLSFLPSGDTGMENDVRCEGGVQLSVKPETPDPYEAERPDPDAERPYGIVSRGESGKVSVRRG